ncbi:hypothetical protein HDU86_000489 [Geranomyces michiganensis]|nr:hypothetical protein HDU86_000489 [Geranomyces michiganensis]
MATSDKSEDIFAFPPASSANPSSRSSSRANATSVSADSTTTANQARRTSNPTPTTPASSTTIANPPSLLSTQPFDRRPSSTGSAAGQKRKAGQLLETAAESAAEMDTKHKIISAPGRVRESVSGVDVEVKPKRARRSLSGAIGSDDDDGGASPLVRRTRINAEGRAAETRRGSASSLRPSPPSTPSTQQPPQRAIVNGQEAAMDNNSDDAAPSAKADAEATKRTTALKKEAAAKVSTRFSARAKRPLAEVDASTVHEHDTRKRSKTTPAHAAASATSAAAASTTGAGSAASSLSSLDAAAAAPTSQQQQAPSTTASQQQQSTHSPSVAGRKAARGKAAASKAPETEESKRRASKSIQDAVTDLLAYDVTDRPEDNALLKAKKALIRKAQSDPVFLTNDKPKMKARCSKLAIDVLDVEEKAINDGTHPCFGELEKKLEKRLDINENTKRHKLEWFDTACDAAIAQADCNFIVRRADKRRNLVRSYQEQIWKLKDEKRVLEDDARWQTDVSVETRARRRQVEIEQLRRSATGVPPYVSEFPQHYRDMLAENRRNGGPVIIPPMLCRGLRPAEIESDLDVIRAAANGYSNHDA